MKNNELTFDRAEEVLRYDAETGAIHWRVSTGRSVTAGDEAGCIAYLNGSNRTPYRRIQVDGKLYTAHRLAWLLHYREWPKHDIDHLDGNGLNNKISNLRDVPASINLRNSRMRSNNASGITGVHWAKANRKWEASARINGTLKYLGLFADIAEAEATVREFRAKHGFTERHGIRS